MSWVPVNDNETPNWTPFVKPGRFGPFQVGAFQTNYQQGKVVVPWTPVNDSETPGWTPV